MPSFRMVKHECEICKTEFGLEKYSTANCPKCGAEVGWEEYYTTRLGNVVNLDLEKGEVTFKIKKE